MSALLSKLRAGIALLAILAPLAPLASAAEKPAISGKIDQIIKDQLDKEKIPASPQADDAEFLRRVYLDITGRIPTAEQATAFLNSKDADKRAKLIDELLTRPEYGVHFATIWRDLLVDRTTEKNQVRSGFSWEFVTWLAEGFNKDRSWDKIVTDLLTAEGEAKSNPASLFILTNRQDAFPRPEDLVGMAGQYFMGMHIRCAQCHNHPYVDEWKQDDFWGVAAFFGQVRDLTSDQNGGSRNPTFAERPNEDAKKETGYINRLKRQGLMPPLEGPRIAIPTIADPTKALRVVEAKFFLAEKPKLDEKGPFRPKFAAWLTSSDNPYFARAAANRLWAHFFAQGIINPVDDMGPNRICSHPELLDLLEKEFKTSGFNPKHLIRCICNSETYQRTSKPLPQNKDDNKLFSHMAVKLLSPDQTIDALNIALGRVPPTGKNRDQFTAPFATKDASDSAAEFSHGIPQFLLMMNGPTTKDQPVLGKLTNGKSKDEAVTAMYLSALSRRPQPKEMQRMQTYLEKSNNPKDDYRDLYWVLLNSAEFVLNR